jgi:peptide chain release factor
MTVHLLMSAGDGPDECCWATANLVRRLEREAPRHGVRAERLETVPGARTGTFRSVLVRLSGAEAEAVAATWTGTLCWQEPSPYRTRHSRKNWYVLAVPCRVDRPRTPFDEADVEVVACRTSGPGGQRRNKVRTAARATHRPSGTVVVVDTERYFDRNRRIALDRLRERLAERDDAAGRALDSAHRQLHQQLVRGDPVRIERPRPGA